jgi:hypothetical protein
MGRYLPRGNAGAAARGDLPDPLDSTAPIATGWRCTDILMAGSISL